MKILNTIIFILTTVNLVSCQNSKIMLGSKISDYKNNTEKLMIPSGALIYSEKISLDNIAYTIGVNQNKIIVYVMTTSSNFKINELNLNSKLKDITSNLDELTYIPGWGYYIKTNSDWFVGFNFNNRPTLDSKINWFFKYNFPQRKKNIFHNNDK